MEKAAETAPSAAQRGSLHLVGHLRIDLRDVHQARVAGFAFAHGLWVVVRDLHVNLLRSIDQH